jgi:hypothetical protein
MLAHIELTGQQAAVEGKTVEEVIQARLESVVEAAPR